MKKIFLASLIILLSFNQASYADTPSEALEIVINQLITIASDKSITDESKKTNLSKIISTEIDFEAVSQRVVSKPWNNASEQQKHQFKEQFLIVMVNTYFALLKEYSDEKVLFINEELKRENYAIVDTELVSGSKKNPCPFSDD